MKLKWIIFIFMTIKHVGSTCKYSVLLYDIFDTAVWHLVFTGVSYIKWIIIMQIFMTIKHVGSTCKDSFFYMISLIQEFEVLVHDLVIYMISLIQEFEVLVHDLVIYMISLIQEFEVLVHDLVIQFFSECSDLSCFCSGHDRMVVGFTTTYAISAYHH